MRALVVGLTIAIAVVAPEVRASLWKPVPAPTKARTEGTLTTLADGRILLAGGRIASLATETTELFDPKTETWSAGNPLKAARYAHGAIRLNDGRVLVAGGVESTSTGILASELFDPLTSTWSPGGLLLKPRVGPFALATDGRVAVVGSALASPPSAAFEIYNPTDNSWKAGPSAADTYAHHAFGPLPNGGFLAAGGIHTTGSERFDPVMNKWLSMPAIDTRAQPSTVALKDGRLLIVGGGRSEAGGLPLIFDSKTSSFRTVVGERWGAAPPVAMLPDGRVVIVGVTALSKARAPAIELFDPTTSTMRVLGNIETTLLDPYVAPIDIEHVLIVSRAASFIVTIPKSCSAASECSSGFCSDGVCCDSACTGQCEACDAEGSIGACTGVYGAPHGKRPICSEPWTPACRARTCDPSRDRKACVEPAVKLACDCSVDANCSSGHCVDGVCCTTACTGQCEACDLPGSLGVCVAVTGEPRGIRKGCEPPGLGICTVQACDGSNTKACVHVHNSETNCDTICGGRVSRHCNGAGACGLPHELKCPDNSCSTASPQPTERPRFLDAMFVLGLAAAVTRGARAWRGAPRPSCPPRDR